MKLDGYIVFTDHPVGYSLQRMYAGLRQHRIEIVRAF